ncbi:MAG: hypothetical protein NTV08_06375 [Verrucomicrobia bacterium]|nr:hypothetical protein [Verrucomicrobiota bacterium]
MVEQAALFPFAPTRGEALFFNLHASNRSVRHGTCFRRRLSAHRAGAAPHSAVAELGVVRRFTAMTRTIPESDWKLFRQLHPIALSRLCQQVLDDIAAIVADKKTIAHERYLKIYKLVQQRDQTIGELFNDLRRSTAIMRLLAICSHNLITEDEIGRFTQETRDVISHFSTQRA